LRPSPTSPSPSGAGSRAASWLGPDIRTVLLPFVPPDGTPRYVRPLRLPEVHGPAAARDSVRARIAAGADGIKLFTVPITEREPFPVMAPEIVAAVTDEAHRAGRLVFAHPTSEAGVRVALEHGVVRRRRPESLLDRRGVQADTVLRAAVVEDVGSVRREAHHRRRGTGPDLARQIARSRPVA
jgi:hypothetical protein